MKKQSEAIAIGRVAATACWDWFRNKTTKSHSQFIGDKLLAALKRRGWTPPKKGKGKK